MDDLHDETSDLAAHVADELTSADGGQIAPLSDARLAEIQRTWRFLDYGNDSAEVDAIKDLLAYVDWLRECEAALLAERERLLAVAAAVDLLGSPCTCPDDPDDDSPWQHEEQCPVKLARAALAAAETEKE